MAEKKQSKSEKAGFSPSLFHSPKIPLVDGRGHIWQTYATDIDALYDYTFGHQINRHYDFSKAIEVAIKEFSPDKIIVLGPGTTLCPPVAQELIKHQWDGIYGKSTFSLRQQTEPLILSMGIEQQRSLAS